MLTVPTVFTITTEDQTIITSFQTVLLFHAWEPTFPVFPLSSPETLPPVRKFSNKIHTLKRNVMSSFLLKFQKQKRD